MRSRASYCARRWLHWLPPPSLQAALGQQSAEDRQHSERLLASLGSDVRSQLQALGVGLGEGLQHVAAAQEELLQGQQGLAQGQEEVLRGQEQLRQAQAAAQKQAQQSAEDILSGQQDAQQDVRAAHSDLKQGQQDIKDHIDSKLHEYFSANLPGRATGGSQTPAAAEHGAPANTAAGETPLQRARSASLPTRVGSPADVWRMAGAQLIKEADKDGSGLLRLLLRCCLRLPQLLLPCCPAAPSPPWSCRGCWPAMGWM